MGVKGIAGGEVELWEGGAVSGEFWAGDSGR